MLIPHYRNVCGLASLALLSACSSEPSGAAGAGGASSSANVSTSSSSSVSSSSGEGGGPAAMPVPMLSLNLHCFWLDGTAFSTNADRFAAIASFAASRDVAVIALQEACERPGESAIEQLRAALEKATAAPWSSTWSFAHVAWENTPEQADEGVGLLVKGALSNPQSLEHVVQGSLRRVAVSASLPAELSGARVTSVHFEVFEPEARIQQAREIAVAALVDTDPSFSAIVAGDFNDVEASPTHAAFPAMGYLAADTGLDPTGIDHVMIHRAANLRPAFVEKVFVGNDAVSDHPGIFVHLEPAMGDDVAPTRITAKVNLGTNQFLALRGGASPLSWDVGFPMRRTSPGEFTFVTTEIAADFEFKTLIDDFSWQTGSNASGKAGMNHVIMPVF